MFFSSKGKKSNYSDFTRNLELKKKKQELKARVPQ